MNHFEYREPDIAGEDLRQVRQQLRRFVAERILPHAEAWEAAGNTPRELILELGELGLLGMRHPAEYGGGAMGSLASVVFAEELARSGYGGLVGGLTVHTDMSITHIAHRGTPEQKQRYLPGACTGHLLGAVCVTEPHAGSDVAGLKTRAVATEDGWTINGSKIFITNGVNADVYIVAARTSQAAKGSGGISLFIVERGTPGLTARRLDKQGWLCSDTAELSFVDMRLPREALLGEEGKGFQYIMSTFQNERLVVGAISSGLAARALELTIDYLKTRQAFGKSLWDQPVIRNRVATAAANANASRAFTYQCAQMIDEGQEATREVSMLKAFAGEMIQELAQNCLQLHGGTGYITGTPIERIARDARVMSIGGGATDVLLEEVAKRL